MDIEEVAARTPEKLLHGARRPERGPASLPRAARRLRRSALARRGGARASTAFLGGLYRLFVEKDASLVEINPLVVTKAGELLALDGKLNFDDNALLPPPRRARAARPRRGGPPRARGQGDRPRLRRPRRRHRLHGERRGARDGDPRHDPGVRRPAGELPGRGRRRRPGEGQGSLQADPARREGEGDPGQHLRRHRALRPDRRGRGGRRPGARGGRAARGAAPGHQRRRGPRDPRGLRARHHARGDAARGRRARRRRGARERGRSGMAILCDKSTRLLVQGLGRMGQFHARLSREYGTQVVAGVHPGKGGQVVDGHARSSRPCARPSPPPAPTRRSSSCRRPGRPTRSSRRRTRACVSRSASPRASRCSTWRAPRRAARLGDAPRRAELPRRRDPRAVPHRHHARADHAPRPGRRGVALGHADLRGRRSALAPRHRPVDLRRHRRRPGGRHHLRGRAAPVPGRSRDRGGGDDRRDRRQRRGDRRRVRAAST